MLVFVYGVDNMHLLTSQVPCIFFIHSSNICNISGCEGRFDGRTVVCGNSVSSGCLPLNHAAASGIGPQQARYAMCCFSHVCCAVLVMHEFSLQGTHYTAVLRLSLKISNVLYFLK